MVESDKASLSCRAYDPCTVEITRYPVALVIGEEILLNDKKVAVVKETCLMHSRENLMQYIAEQNKPVEIEPNEADVRIEVGPDGVFIGFFSDGKAALLSMDVLSQALGSEGSAAIKAWIYDRKNQAERLSLDNGA